MVLNKEHLNDFKKLKEMVEEIIGESDLEVCAEIQCRLDVMDEVLEDLWKTQAERMAEVYKRRQDKKNK